MPDEKEFQQPAGGQIWQLFQTSSIKGEVWPEHDDGWSEFVADRANHNVGLAPGDISVDDLDELSDAEIAALETVWVKFGGMTQW